MSAILEFFKEKNLRTWRKVQTFVIDKHFVEWQVLGSCFPHSKVLLCQFHALVYRKRIQGTTFGLRPADRDIA
ncbi:hypothetical protein JG688_00015407 [Phytophthora aleatoria]|uniref:ZSWIM1/3 RNaseH-like domain-containing protein n=1 Tax=Phytophthora aleatoria TaxID=2496075 RepID=A0A8J5ITA1_9STRA|nr:hypothetical protein JG688_00015407 [Phytophthora aleatoria]